MPITRILLLAVALAPSAVRAECRASEQIVKMRVALQHPSYNIAGVMVSVLYPADKLVIEGQGRDAARAALGKLPDGASVLAEDRDGELHLLFGKPEALTVDPLCEITFHRCEGAESIGSEEVSCRVTDASDAGANKLTNVRCSIAAAPS